MKALLLLPAVALLLTFAACDSNTETDARQETTQGRIEAGKESGELTTSEANRLEQKQENLDNAQRRAMADSHITQQEADKLDRKADRLENATDRKLHNGRKK